MISKSQYKNKIEVLAPFLEYICQGIKKEIRQEFIQKGALPKGLESKEVSQFFYKKVVELGDEKVGEWLASSWIYKNGEIFQSFHEELSLIDSQYEKLEKFPVEAERELLATSVLKFGALRVYLFSVLNSVVFSQESFDKLSKGALEELSSLSNPLDEVKKSLSVEELQASFEVEKRKLEEKYEKRLQGALKKCQLEVEGYRKQIGQLQKKLEKQCV
jgi:hypothetical protein